MSPGDRAKLSLLIEADGDTALRQHLLGALGRAETPRRAHGGAREVPDRWTQIHVLDRLEEAYQVLAGMPMMTRPKQYGNAMPTPDRERLSFKDLIEMQGAGDLEQMHEDRNRVRIAPTSAQVTRMEQALRWPFEHLSDQPELAKAIQLRAMWSAMGADIRKRCERRGMDHGVFNASWQRALAVITGALIASKVPVT